MFGKFKREFEIGARAITPSRTPAPSDMFDLLQEAATFHSDMLGYDMDFFKREQTGWALLNWHAEFERLPKWREKIIVETWPTVAGRGLAANRCFNVLDSSGNSIMKAFSQWVYFDKIRRRPKKISDEMLHAYNTDIENILPPEKNIIVKPDESAKIGGGRLTVRRSHTDSNFHVNNVAYIKWAEDDLPDDVFRSGMIKTVRVNYRKEAKKGFEVETSAYETCKNNFVCFIRDLEGNTFAEIMMIYE